MTEAVSVAEAYAGVSTGASAEVVAVLAAGLVGRSIGHLVRYRYFSVHLLVSFCVSM